MSSTGKGSAERAADSPAAAACISVMCAESGIQETLMNKEEQVHTPQHYMNEPKEMKHVSSGTLRSMEDGPAAKRIKVKDTRPASLPRFELSDKSALSSFSLAPLASATPLSKASSALSIDVPELSSKVEMASQASPGSEPLPQITTTSASEGSTSFSSLDHPSRPGSSAQLAKPASTSENEKLSVAAAGSGPSTSEAPRSALHLSSSQTASPPSPPPLKSTTMLHLHKKFTAELEYMLREFRKLERQLLGAKVNGAGVEENAGSRERREKLHSFILHLEDTLRQIELGCRLEAEGKSTVMIGVTVGGTASGSAPTEEDVKQKLADSGALTSLTKEKEEEENVQKLEEHILANLLPVKVRLKKQLAAQQGASRNPVGMPVARRGMLPSASAEKGTGTFAAAAEQRRRQAEAAAAAAAEKDSQFGKVLGEGASSLTQKLHGQTLGSSSRMYGAGVGSLQPTDSDAPEAAVTQADGESAKTRKILYAGMVPGSSQLQSGVAAAAGVHRMVIDTPGLYRFPKGPAKAKGGNKVPEAALSASVKSSKPAALPQHPREPDAAAARKVAPSHLGQKVVARDAATLSRASNKQATHDSGLSEEERKKLRKLRKRKRLRKLKQQERERHLQILRQQQPVPPKVGAAGKKSGKTAAGKAQGKKKGPRTVEYICALCSDVYSSTCDCNPWWALTSHDCPKCRKTQVPRIDISSPANAIEYHPALLAHAEENGSSPGSGGGAPSSAAPGGTGVMHINPSHTTSSATSPIANSMPNHSSPGVASDSDSGSELSDLSDGDLSDDSYDSDDSLDNLMGIMSPAEQAENEQFGVEYNGPKLTDDQSSRLLTLMSHASTCPGRHKHAKHRDVCNSLKYLMLHVRDCPGTTATFDICPFPWCRKVKHMLYHLVACIRPKDCPICAPTELSPNLSALTGLNNYRRKKQQERRAAAKAAAAAAAEAKKPPPVSRRAQILAKQSKTPARPVMSPKAAAAASAAAIKAGYKPAGVKPVAGATLAHRKGLKTEPTTHPPSLPAAGKPSTPNMPGVSGAKGAPFEVAKIALTDGKPTSMPGSKLATTAAASSQLVDSVLSTSMVATPLPTATAAASSSTVAQVSSTASGAASSNSIAHGKSPSTAAVTPVLVESDGEMIQPVAMSAANEPVAVVQPVIAVASVVDKASEDIAVKEAESGETPKAHDGKTILLGSEIVAPSVEATSLLMGANFSLKESNFSSSAARAESHTEEGLAVMKPKEEPDATSTNVADSSPVVTSETGSPVDNVAAIEVSIQAATAMDVKTGSGDFQEDMGNGRDADLSAEQGVKDEKSRTSPPTRSSESSGMTSSCSGEFKKNAEIVRISC